PCQDREKCVKWGGRGLRSVRQATNKPRGGQFERRPPAGEPNVLQDGTRRRRFCLVLVKPSHYDDDDYVIQWYRSAIPSNSLAAVYGLARDCAERRCLGEDTDIEIHAFDETNTRIRADRIAALIEA